MFVVTVRGRSDTHREVGMGGDGFLGGDGLVGGGTGTALGQGHREPLSASGRTAFR